jgi:hypothetical protein
LKSNFRFSKWFSVPTTKGVEEDDMTDIDRSFDENVYDLNAILHPGSVFDRPRDVQADTALSRAEKRAILASWASDAAAVTSCPSLRAVPGAKRPVSIDEILEALSSLDHSPRNPPGGKPARLKSTARTPLAA